MRGDSNLPFFLSVGLGGAAAIILGAVLDPAPAASGAPAFELPSTQVARTDPHELRGACAAAFVRARALAPHRLAGAQLSIADPEILQDGATPMIACAFTDRGGGVGIVHAMVMCRSEVRPCVTLASIRVRGRRVWSAL